MTTAPGPRSGKASVSPPGSAGAATVVGDECLVVERQGDVQWWWLNRPARRNALDPHIADALDAAIEGAAADAATALVVIAGTGPSFCAGADLRYLHELAANGGDPLPFLSGLSATFTRLERLPKPVIAAVHGHVVAGGLELALACDVVVARRGTMIGDGHVRNGLVPAAGASVRLPRKVGVPLAAWLMLTGELLPAEAFVASGFVHAVVAEPDFAAVLATTIEQLRAGSGPLLGRIKQLLGAQRQPVDEALAAELAIFGAHWHDASTNPAGALARFAAGQR